MIGYDVISLKDEALRENYQGEVTEDRYGRQVPKHAHGSENLEGHTASSREITEAVLAIYDRVVDPTLFVRRMSVTANHVIEEQEALKAEKYEQLELFKDYGAPPNEAEQKEKDAHLQSRHRIYHEIAAELYPCQKRIGQLLEETVPGSESSLGV